MSKSRKLAVLVGVLFVIATVFLFIGRAFYEPYLELDNFLNLAYPSRMRVILGLLLEFLCVLAIPLIAIVLFPILKKTNEWLALGYVFFRSFEAILFVGDEIDKLSLISISQIYLESGRGEAEVLVNMGKMVWAGVDWRFFIYVIVFAIGSLMLNWMLYVSRLVPRWIGGFGLGAAGLILIGTVLAMFEVEVLPFEGGFELLFAMPIAVQEMMLAGWLILRGFNEGKKK